MIYDQAEGSRNVRPRAKMIGAADLFVKTESGTKKGPDVARALDEEKKPEKPAFFSLPIRSVSRLPVFRRGRLVQIHDDRQQSGDGSPGEPT